MTERLKLLVLLPNRPDPIALRFDDEAEYSRFTQAVDRQMTLPIQVTEEDGHQFFLRPAAVIGYS